MIQLSKENKIPFQIIENNNGLQDLKIKIVDHVITLPDNKLIEGHTQKYRYKIIKITFSKGCLISERLNIIQEQISKAKEIIKYKPYYLTETSNEIYISDREGKLKKYCKFFGLSGLLLFSLEDIK
jgi:hypothetical protein|nr:MAG TPA: hypothetical protein [Caudoviricetes sp.]